MLLADQTRHWCFVATEDGACMSRSRPQPRFQVPNEDAWLARWHLDDSSPTKVAERKGVQRVAVLWI